MSGKRYTNVEIDAALKEVNETLQKCDLGPLEVILTGKGTLAEGFRVRAVNTGQVIQSTRLRTGDVVKFLSAFRAGVLHTLWGDKETSNAGG